MTGPVALRLARTSDAAAIRAIYNLEVTGGVATFDLVPRTLADQQAWLTEHAGAHPAVVAMDRGSEAVLGFGSLSEYRPRPAYVTSVEDSLYVHPDHQGRGIGGFLLAELLALATIHGFHAVLARIARGNDASVKLHRSHGFDHVGVEREIGRKFGRWLDVVVMQRLL
jgi:phosphinothricin acetyltransferase